MGPNEYLLNKQNLTRNTKCPDLELSSLKNRYDVHSANHGGRGGCFLLDFSMYLESENGPGITCFRLFKLIIPESPPSQRFRSKSL